jgi:TP901 family phage tail tape measure protein
VPDIKLTLDADVSKALRANQQLETSEAKLEAQFGRTARAAQRSSEQIGQSAQHTAEVYELAAESTESSMLRFGTSTSRRGGATRPYSMAPMPAAVASAAASAVARYGGDALPLASEYQADRRMRDTRLYMSQHLHEVDAIEARMRDNTIARAANLRASQFAGASDAGSLAAAEFEARSMLNPANIASVTSKSQAVDRVRAELRAERGLKEEQSSDLRLLRFQNRMEADREYDAKIERYAGKTWGAFAGGVKMAGAAAMAGTFYMQGLEQRYEQMAMAGAGFEDSMTPLLGVAGNQKNAARIRELVLARSTAWGMPGAQVANTMYDVQSTASNLTASTQAQIVQNAALVSRVKGGDMDTIAVALSKIMQNYGGEFKGNVGAAANKMSAIEERASVNFQDLATLLPDVLPAAKELGATFNEVGGALEVVTQRAGRNERAFTGFRNTILRLNKAEEEGIHLSGSLTDKFTQLHSALSGMGDDSRTQVMQKIFGEETITYASILLNNVEQLRRSVDALSKIDLSNLDKLFRLKFGDPAFTTTQELKSIMQDQQNIPASRMQDPKYQKDTIKAAMIRAGADLVESPLLPDAIKQGRIASELAKSETDADYEGDYYVAEKNHRLSQLQQAAASGDKNAKFEYDFNRLMLGDLHTDRVVPANYLGSHRLKSGETYDIIMNPKADFWSNTPWGKQPLVNGLRLKNSPTDESDADLFRRWWSKGIEFSADKYSRLKQLGIDAPNALPQAFVESTNVDEALAAKGYAYNAQDFLNYAGMSDSEANKSMSQHRTLMRRASDFAQPILDIGAGAASFFGAGRADTSADTVYDRFHAAAETISAAAAKLHAGAEHAMQANKERRTINSTIPG